MIAVIAQCVESGNEDGARKLFDVFETLLILVCLLSIGLINFFLIIHSLGNSCTQSTYPSVGSVPYSVWW